MKKVKVRYNARWVKAMELIVELEVPDDADRLDIMAIAEEHRSNCGLDGEEFDDTDNDYWDNGDVEVV